MRTKTRFAFLAKKQLLLQYRPQHRPQPQHRCASSSSSPSSGGAGADARAWWKYALILLTGRGDVLADKVGGMADCVVHTPGLIAISLTVIGI